MAAVSQEQVMARLRTVMNPQAGGDLVSLGMIDGVDIKDALVTVYVKLTSPACSAKAEMAAEIEAAVRSLDGVKQVDVMWAAAVSDAPQPEQKLPGVKQVIVVGAGKGGVGKSTAAVLLAYGLKQRGASVGLLDADVYGPSIPMMTGVSHVQPTIEGTRVLPVDAGGVKVMSMGLLIDPDTALIWRGPRIQGVLKQFIEQVDWGELDYLLVDLPPGTGDVPLSIAQALDTSGAIVICTPQDIALLDARRALKMYQELHVPCVGIIENMSYYVCPSCGHRDELFDHGGARRAAEELGVSFLGEIPLNAGLRACADGGTPEKALSDGDDFVTQAIAKVVDNTAMRTSVMGRGNSACGPCGSCGGCG